MLEDRRLVVRQSRSLGFGINNGKVAHGLASVAVAIHDPSGAPFASLSTVSDVGPYTNADLRDVVLALRADALAIEQAVAHLMEDGRRAPDGLAAVSME